MTRPHKLMEACDWNEDRQIFPCIAQPKVDGVRGKNVDGTLRGRSLKEFPNKHTQAKYSQPFFNGFDGELTNGAITGESLCRDTTSALTTIEGQPAVGWCVFDYHVPGETDNMGFQERYTLMLEKLEALKVSHPDHAYWLWAVPCVLIESLEDMLKYEQECLEQGYEGIVLRDINKPYKHGRSTAIQCNLTRVKRFIEGDALVVELHRGQHNTNEATINERGQTERSSHQAGMVDSDLLGSMTCINLNNIHDPITGELLIKQGQCITVSPGKMSHDVRREYMATNSLINGVIKFQFFPKGMKDRPRFPTCLAVRDTAEMGAELIKLKDFYVELSLQCDEATGGDIHDLGPYLEPSVELAVSNEIPAEQTAEAFGTLEYTPVKVEVMHGNDQPEDGELPANSPENLHVVNLATEEVIEKVKPPVPPMPSNLGVEEMVWYMRDNYIIDENWERVLTKLEQLDDRENMLDNIVQILDNGGCIKR